jgi:uncharacterized membrane protein
MMRRWKRSRARKPPQGLVVRFQNHVQIDRPIDEVFAFAADFRNVPKWNYFVREVEQETEGSVGLGMQHRQIRKHDEQRFKITEFNPPRIVSIETTPDWEPAFRMRFRFLQRGDRRTLLSDTWELDSVSHSFRARLFSRRMKQAAAENLYKLKELWETGSTTLRDGRAVTR